MPKKNQKRIINTLEEAAGNGPMMVYTGSRTQEDLQFMTDYVTQREKERENKITVGKKGESL